MRSTDSPSKYILVGSWLFVTVYYTICLIRGDEEEDEDEHDAGDDIGEQGEGEEEEVGGEDDDEAVESQAGSDAEDSVDED